MSLIPLINTGLLAAIGISFALIFTCSSPDNDEIQSEILPPKKIELPPHAFSVENSSYEKIGSGPFALEWKEPQIELPDLKEELIYHGLNDRPDIKEDSFFHIALKSSNLTITAADGVKTYLVYNKGIYSFSPDNEPTQMWCEMTPLRSGQGESLDVKLTMRGENGKLITTPEQSHHFTLKASEAKNTINTGWELPDGPRVDGSLLARQRARFVGPDLFMQKHGGDEFSFALDRDRIDFVDNEEIYSIYVKEGDSLIWKERKWQLPERNEETIYYPLLVTKKIDDKMVHFELWEANGLGRVPLNLIKMKLHEGVPELAGELKFVGAKTWSQFIVECGFVRMTLRPNDWLLYLNDGWHKIEKAEEVDAYVNQKTIGPLFVLDKMVKKEGKRILLGHLFNASRTEMLEIELCSSDSKGLPVP